MRIINKRYLLIILLVGIILTSLIIFKPKENIKLDNVILKQEVNGKTFAMYKEDGENNYVKVEDNKFPDMCVLNLTESKCIDNNGNEIKDALSYENDEVVLTSNKTVYCYLYFDKSLGLEIKDEDPNGLSICEYDTEDKYEQCGGMHRFQGQQADGIENYICFGTSDKEDCVKDTNHYMYRIIGIEAETGRVKVIKKEALKETENGTYKWYTDYDHDIEFPYSNIYKAISGSDFLENPDYVPEGWEEKIATNTWMYGDMLSDSTIGARQTGEELYKTETGKKETQWRNYATEETPGAIKTTVSWNQSPYKDNIVYYTNGSGNWTESFTGKVSLIYLHDYYLSISNTANCQYEEGQYAECKTGWMHLSQNDSSVSGIGVHEWTMSRYGWWPVGGCFQGRYVHGAGYANIGSLITSMSVRPVFYISASEELLDGEGTIENPFIIKE